MFVGSGISRGLNFTDRCCCQPTSLVEIRIVTVVIRGRVAVSCSRVCVPGEGGVAAARFVLVLGSFSANVDAGVVIAATQTVRIGPIFDHPLGELICLPFAALAVGHRIGPLGSEAVISPGLL